MSYLRTTLCLVFGAIVGFIVFGGFSYAFNWLFPNIVVVNEDTNLFLRAMIIWTTAFGFMTIGAFAGYRYSLKSHGRFKKRNTKMKTTDPFE